MRARGLLALTILLAAPTVAFSFLLLGSYGATTSGGQVNRIFYLTSTGKLSSDRPQPGPPLVTVLNQSSLYFEFENPILSSITLYSPIEFHLWLNSNKTDVNVSLQGSFHEKFFGSNTFNNVTSVSTRTIVNPSVNPINFSYPIPSQPLVPLAQIGVSFRLQNLTQGALVRLFYNSESSPSHIILPLSGYLRLESNRVDVLDINLVTTSSFNLNSTIPGNVIFFQAPVRSALGYSDIKRVNLTIYNPVGVTVRGATNLTMLPVDSDQQTQPFVYATSWAFPPNATEGIYQVFVSIIDIQDSLAYRLGVPATFILTRGFFLPPPFDIVPYAALGGAFALGGLFYYRKRRSKSYLVPFDHFHSLTGGELDPGTFVAVEGNTGSGKTILSQQLMFEDLKKGRPCIFVATADFPSNIRSSMKEMGMDVSGYESSGLLTIVDGYSSEAGQESTEEFSIPSLADLTTTGIKITSSLPADSFKGGSLYFDSIIPLASKAKPESIVSFIQSLGARVKGMSGKAFFTSGPSVDPTVQRQLEDIADCVVEMEAFEESGVRRNRLRIAKYRARRHQQGWVIYSIEDGRGIIFYTKKPRR